MNPPQATLWTETESPNKTRESTPTNIKQHVAQRLAYFMNGESQQRLSKRAKVSQASVQRILISEQVATIEMLVSLANGLNIHPASFLLDQETDTAVNLLPKLSETDRREVLNFIEYKLWKGKTNRGEY